MDKQKNKKVRQAVALGIVCSLSYLAVYIARNILGAVSPKMIESGSFNTETIGVLSSFYYIVYAGGQLINGMIGQRAKAKTMVATGLIMAGFCCILFTVFSKSGLLYVVYGLMALFLSMIYAPLVKVVSENTEPLYAVRCNLGYTFSSLFGSPLAGLAAAFLAWRSVFLSSGIALIAMGTLCYFAFRIFEKRGYIQYKKYTRKEKSSSGIKLLFEREIVKYTVVAVLTGVVRTSVVFWMPTYISQRLGFSSKSSSLIFTVSTLVISLIPFFAVFLYEKMGCNTDRPVLLAFCVSAAAFSGVYIVGAPVLNIVFLVIAIMASNTADSVMWSCYLPGLGDTGMVSGVAGFLDCVSYVAAAAASTLFANAVSRIGWGNLVLVWTGLMVLGVVASLPFRRARRISIKKYTAQ